MKAITATRARLAAWAITLGLAFSVAGGAEPPAAGDGAGQGKPERKGPLATLPSAPRPHVEKIRALGDRAWVELGAPQPDPKKGPARGRSWSSHMNYAPGLGGAFFFGEGPHGGMFDGNHYADDLYFYDANAHAWICCYPGFDVTRYGEVRINADGFESLDGAPLPIATMVHAYESTTYDPERRRFMSIPCPGNYWQGTIKGRFEALEKAKASLNEPGGLSNRLGAGGSASPWLWDADTGSWARSRTRMAGPAPSTSGGNAFIYVPSLKKAWAYHGGAAVSYYHPAANEWTKLTAKGPQPPFGIDFSACLDSKRERIYFGGGYYPVAAGDNALWCYDLKTDTFVDLKPKGAPGGGSKRWGPNTAMLNYDSVNDAVLLFHFGHGGDEAKRDIADLGIFAYDPAANEWTAVAEGKEFPWAERALKRQGYQFGCRSGFYHPELNAHFVLAACDGDTKWEAFAYRHRKAGK